MSIFETNAFSCSEMTAAINCIPSTYGRIQELGIFQDEGVWTTSVSVESKKESLDTYFSTQRGSPVSVSKYEKITSLNIPQIIHKQILSATDLNICGFGQTSDQEAIMDRVLERLKKMRSKHDMILEYMRCGALQGRVRDEEGKVLVDLFEEFGVTPKEVDFSFSDPETDIPKVCREVYRYIEDHLMGEGMTHIRALCSSEFFEGLIMHPSMKEAWSACRGVTPLRDDFRCGFGFEGILFEKYRGYILTEAGERLDFIPKGDACFFPMGTHNTFITYYAPADFPEATNTEGLPLYARQVPSKLHSRVELHTLSCPLPVCTHPDVLVRGYSSSKP